MREEEEEEMCRGEEGRHEGGGWEGGVGEDGVMEEEEGMRGGGS